MKNFTLILILFPFFFTCQSQIKKDTAQKLVGGPCEGCEAIFEYGNKMLTAIDTLPGFDGTEPKLKITGIAYKKDRKTPAKDVILYIYHTNRAGIYETRGGEKGWAKRHGYIRGWVKTGKDGKYTFYTFRPGAYPGRNVPEHIHITVKEPGKSEYYLDDYVFDDDPLLTKTARNRLQNRGGTGVVKLRTGDGISLVERDIILGHQIPDYE